MAAKSSLGRALFPLAVVLGVGTVQTIPAAPLSGGACLATGLAVGGLPARVLVGVGVAWLGSGVRSEGIGRRAVAPESPVVLRGDLGLSRGRDRWGRHRQVLRVRSLRRGSTVTSFDREVDVRSPDGVAPGRVRVKGLLRQRGDGAWALTIEDRRLISYESDSSAQAPLQGLRRSLRRHARTRIGVLVREERRRNLLESLTLGRADGLDPALRATFRRLGLGHLFAVSGLHVGIFAGVAWLLTCRRRPGRRRLVVASLVLAYALILDPRGSVLRAATVLVLWQGVELLGRRLDPLPALAACLAVLGLASPAWYSDLGLQLSALAVAGILIVGVPLAARWTPRLGWAGGLLAIGLAAQVATIPLSAAHFHWLSPLAPVYGLLAVPWAACLLTLAAIGILLPLPGITAAVIGPCLHGLLGLGLRLGGLPPSVLDGWPVTGLEGVTYAAGVLSLLAATSLTSLRRGVRLLTVALGAAAVLAVVLPGKESGPRMVMLDVGQGDSLLFQDGGRNLLVDGGSDGRRLLAQLADMAVRDLDVLVLSHPDRDHCQGGLELARWIRVGAVWMPSGWQKDCYWRLLTLPGVRLQPLWTGRRRTWNGFHVETLAPTARGTRVDNDDSLVLRLSHGAQRLLLTGDIEFRGERKLLRRAGCGGVRAEVLKVAHHGGRSSSRPELLRCVAPRVALISAGAENVFGHPAPQVLGRLRALAVDVRRSDREGSVVIDLGPG